MDRGKMHTAEPMSHLHCQLRSARPPAAGRLLGPLLALVLLSRPPFNTWA